MSSAPIVFDSPYEKQLFYNVQDTYGQKDPSSMLNDEEKYPTEILKEFVKLVKEKNFQFDFKHMYKINTMGSFMTDELINRKRKNKHSNKNLPSKFVFLKG